MDHNIILYDLAKEEKKKKRKREGKRFLVKRTKKLTQTALSIIH